MPDSDPDQPQQPNESESEQPVEQDRTGRTGHHRPRNYRSAQQAGPSYPFRPATPVRRWWANAGMRIGTSPTVHAVRIEQCPDGSQRPAPACHTGHDRADHAESLHPIRDEAVSCRNCWTYPTAWAEGEPYVPGLNQLMLALPGISPLPSWPPNAPPPQDT